MKTKRNSRLERPKKQYPIDQCALYGLRGTGQLLRALNWNRSESRLEKLAYRRSSYRVWPHKETGRIIEEATGELRVVQARIATLLRRICPPDYRHAGVRGRSYITNARRHTQADPSIKLDISVFYPSTKFSHVYKMFVNRFQCAPDLAILLTKLCCYNDDHVPTGGVHSEVVAFYAHKDLFDELNDRVTRKGGVFSVYIDDMMLTFDTASKTDLQWARRAIERQGLELNGKKSELIPKRCQKTITGVCISAGRIRAPQKSHLKVLQRFKDLESASDEEVKNVSLSLLGHLDHIAQIDDRFRAKAQGNRARLKPIMK